MVSSYLVQLQVHAATECNRSYGAIELSVNKSICLFRLDIPLETLLPHFSPRIESYRPQLPKRSAQSRLVVEKSALFTS